MDKERKLKKYQRLCTQIEGYLGTTDDVWARLATIEAVLHHKIQYFFWTGVYFLDSKGDLIVRSYQGPVACQKLRKDTGVCWAAVNSGKTVIVEDVNSFPGHIACNSATKSEIVVPIRDKSGNIFACFDVDSVEYASFDDADKQGIEMILELIHSVPLK